MRRHSGQQQYQQALQIAKDHNMFVVEKNGRYRVFRKTPERPVCLGECRSPEALFRKVSHCASTH